MHQNRNKAHIGKFAIVLYPVTADSRHQVTAKKAEISIAVYRLDGFHKI